MFHPVPQYKDGRMPRVSSGYLARPWHIGSDIMYPRAPSDEGAPGTTLPHLSTRHFAPWGVPVFSIMDGTVVESYKPSKGNYIKIEHPDGFTSQYMHLASRDVQVGNRVSAGEKIGKMGADPGYPLIHLHFQMRKNGALIDPAPYLASATVKPWPTSPWLYAGVVAGGVGLYWYWRNYAQA